MTSPVVIAVYAPPLWAAQLRLAAVVVVPPGLLPAAYWRLPSAPFGPLLAEFPLQMQGHNRSLINSTAAALWHALR